MKHEVAGFSQGQASAGPDFADKQFFVFVFGFVFFYNLDISADLFVFFPESTQIAEMIPAYKTHYTSLISHYVSKLCSCLAMVGKKSFANKQKRRKIMFTGVFTFYLIVH